MACRYCFYNETGLKLVQLSPNPRAKKPEWQYPMWVCAPCRRYLKGYYRLVKEGK